MSARNSLIVVAALALPCILSAQEQVAQPRADISAEPVTPGAPSIFGDVHIDGWGAVTRGPLSTVTLGPPTGIPRWNLGFRAERRLSTHLLVGGMATLTRGENGSVMLSQEIGTGRNLGLIESFTGPGTYQTVFNTALTVSVPLKDSGRVNLKALGELWNPLSSGKKSVIGADTPLNGRAFRIGLLTTF